MKAMSVQMSDLPLAENLTYRIGKIKADRFWIQTPDGRMLQIDTDTKRVLERLAAHQEIQSISDELGVEAEDISNFLEMLGLAPAMGFILVDETKGERARRDLSDHEGERRNQFLIPWIERRWFMGGMGLAIVLSIIGVFQFIVHAPLIFVGSIKDLWLVAGCLTISVIIHEIGHLLTMPRNRNISISVQWSGPIPLLSIICNEAWKLSKWQRIRINLAGFVADLLVAGIGAAIGLLVEEATPWIWTFLFAHIIRMIFALWPFLPGDGYWMLVDLFDQPNLWANATSQLKRLKMSWLSLYALGRIVFLGLIWLLYAYVIFMWTNALTGRTWAEVLFFFLHPVPLLITLNLLYMLIAFGMKSGKFLKKSVRKIKLIT